MNDSRESYVNKTFQKYAEVYAQAVDRSLLVKRELRDFSMERDFNVDIASFEPTNALEAMSQPFPNLSYTTSPSILRLSLIDKKTRKKSKSA